MPKTKRWTPPKSNKGWQLTSNKHEYKQDLVNTFSSEDQPQLDSFDAAIADVACRHGGTQSAVKPQDSAEVVDLRARRKHATCSLVRTDLSKQLHRAIRRQRRLRDSSKLDELIKRRQANKLNNVTQKQSLRIELQI